MAKSSKSATLPPNLRVVAPPSDENDSFFSKLKKRFKIKKGRYNVDVNTGECENVSAVSFKKRSSGELLDPQESPLKQNIGRSSERITRSESPKQAKPASRTQSDRYMTTYFGHRPKVEVKTSVSGNISSSSKKSADKGSLDSLDKKKSKVKSEKGASSNKNEYSAINYDRQDPHVTKPFTFEKDRNVVNDCVATDDSAIDLDNVGTAGEGAAGAAAKSVPIPPTDLSPLEPGYESLPEVVQRASLIQTPLSPDEPGYESVRDVRKKIHDQNLQAGKLPVAGSDKTLMCSGVDFDPNYESVDDVKKKMNERYATEKKASDKTLKCSESLDSLDDPRYQSVKDAKMKPPKTYDITKSIESLDEPGYESLNDVKKRISTMDFDRNVPNQGGTVPGSSRVTTEQAESNELTDLAKSKDSGFESKSEKSIDIEDNMYSKVNKKKADGPALEDLYSSVKKNTTSTDGGKKSSGGGGKADRKSGNVVATGLAQVESLIGAIVTGLTQVESNVEATAISETKVEVKTGVPKTDAGMKVDDGATGGTEGKSVDDDKAVGDVTGQAKSDAGDDKVAPAEVKNTDDIDSETELILDPGYAECADAIKGYNPYSLYSDGSGSKISSCASLDLSAEDFVVEPGYAECADAIKTGAIKKISVSHEKLVVTERPVADASQLDVEGASEIYAVPQVLFRKRSKLLEERSSGEFSMTSLNSDTDLVGSMESVQSHSSVKSATLEEEPKVEEAYSAAPPLPARNYSLYCESDEAEEILPSALIDEKIAENDGDDDDAFEKECSDTPNVVGDVLESRRRNESSGFVVSEHDDGSEVHLDNLDQRSADAGNVDSLNREQMRESVDDSSIKVIVKEKDGDKKVLTVLEKQPSLRIQQKRKAQSTASNETSVQCSNSCINDVQICDVEGAELVSKTDLKSNGNVQSKPCHSLTESERTLNAVRLPGPPGLPDRNYSESDVTEERSSETVIENDSSGNCVVNDDRTIQTADSHSITEQLVPIASADSDESELDQVDGIVNDAGFNVVVEGNDGCTKMLTIIEKEPSFKIQQKRNSRKTNNEISSTQCSKIYTKQIQQNCDVTSDRSNTDTKDVLHSDGLKRSQLPASSHQTCVVNVNVPRSTSEVFKGFPEATGTITNHAYHEEELCSGTTTRTNTESYLVCHSEVTIKIDSQSTGNDETLVQMPEFQPHAFFNDRNILRPSGLELTGLLSEEEELKRSVKMKSISIDSDSDDSPGLDHLPVLAINESDLEDAFDDNGTNIDIRTDDTNVALADCTDEDDTNGKKDGIKNSRASQLVSNEMPKFNVSQDSGLFLSEHNTVEEKLCDSLMNKNDDALNSQSPCVDNSTNELVSIAASSANINNDLVQFSTGASDDIVNNAADAGQEGDASSEEDEACDTEDKGHDSGCECCMEKSANADESSHSLNTELKALPRNLNPDLYTDREPTHMSLAEVMGATSPSTSGFKLSSSMDECLFASVRDLESDRNSDIWARDRVKNIPSAAGDDVGFRPPPRPPVSSAASRMESSAMSHGSYSNHSSQSSEASPSALSSAPFIIGSGSSQSDDREDDTPPAIPPRASRIKKQTRPASSAQDFMESMRQLKDCGWYWGPLSWEEAELKLNNKPEGTFLVRDSSDERYILSLSFKNMGRVHHTRIEHHKGHFSFWSQPDSHGKSTIKEFIEQCVTNSQNGRFLYFIRPSGPGSPPMPIHLLYPVSRFVQMRSLQHMCRFTILQIVRRDHIDDLPVPTRIKQYLKEAQYYVEYLDD